MADELTAPLEPVEPIAENAGAAGIPTATATDDNYEEIRGRDGFKRTKDSNVIIGENGRKYVREEALHEERRRASGYAQTIADLEPYTQDIQEAIARRKTGGPKPDPQQELQRQADTYTTEELEGYAATMGWYDRAGNFDTKRAQAGLDVMSKVSKRQANAAVAPVSAQNNQERGRQLHSLARQGQFVDGEAFADQKYIDAAFQSLPEQYRGDPEIAQAATLIAAGIEYLDLRKGGQLRKGGRRGEPNFREASGGRFGGGESALDELDQQAARSRGKSESEWSKMTRGGRPDATGGYILEDV